MLPIDWLIPCGVVAIENLVKKTWSGMNVGNSAMGHDLKKFRLRSECISRLKRAMLSKQTLTVLKKPTSRPTLGKASNTKRSKPLSEPKWSTCLRWANASLIASRGITQDGRKHAAADEAGCFDKFVDGVRQTVGHLVICASVRQRNILYKLNASEIGRGNGAYIKGYLKGYKWNSTTWKLKICPTH